MTMGTEIKNVFVSHYHEDEDSIKNLRTLLGDKYELHNYSVTSEKFNNAKMTIISRVCYDP